MSENRKKAPEGTDNPFAQLPSLVRQAGIRLQPEEKPKSKPAPPMPARLESRQQAEDPDQVFADAMEGVARIHWRQDPAPSAMTPSQPVFADPEGEDERLFHEAVGADLTPPILDHPEYIEGWVGVAGQRFLPNLRTGVYSIQGSIDLHGLSRIEAREAVEAFIIRMSRERSCCVKIVHGRGINSASDRAILKEHLPRWLATRRMSHHVVAYASAPYTDGGVGAICVLLRRCRTGS
jgi:DNA-nicking Smr family endonuclease